MNNGSLFGNNPVTQLFGIQYPLIQAGMVWCSGWRLAAAVSNAGGLGLIGSGSMEPETLREHIRKCKAATGKPFGVNVPLLYRHIEGNIRVLREEGVNIVFSSAGNPSTWTSSLKADGIKVVHVVSNTKFARKAEDAGVDAVVAEGFEAGGHNGKEELTTFVLVPLVRAAVRIPVIAAGGIGSGAGMLAAMALGADGVQIGSRFVASAESSAHEHFKQEVISTHDDSTILALKEIGAVRMIKNAYYEKTRELGSRPETLEELKLFVRGKSRTGMFEGDIRNGELEIGQVAALVKKIIPAGEIVEEIIREYAERRALL